MNKKTVSGILLTLLLIGILTLAFNVQPVRASGTIYIKADGAIDPPTANITSSDNITYYFTENNHDEIVVQRDNIVVDGAGFTLQGTGAFDSKGISTDRSNVTIKNMEIRLFCYGIWLYEASNNTISGNNITENNWWGIDLYTFSNYNSISGNTITNNNYGVRLNKASNYNSISGNTITNNDYGIQLNEASKYNSISGNTITNNGIGIWLSDSSNYNSIFRNNITNNNHGIELVGSSNYNSISGNTITNKLYGIWLDGSSNNTISGNNITANIYQGIRLVYGSSSNTISENNITNNDYGIWLYWASNYNIIRHNNFVDNAGQVYLYLSSNNLWDDGYPSGGNYWSDHVTVDDCCGINQDEFGSDGIVDEPYLIDGYNRDNCPLMAPINFFNAGTWNEVTYYVNTVSNSTVSDFYFDPDEGAFIRIDVTEDVGTTGFCRVTIPKLLLWVEDGWVVLVGNEPVEYTIVTDDNYTYLYFTYNHSTKTVEILGTNVVPEFPTWTSILLLLIVFTIAIAIIKRRLLKKPFH